jgi:hypothetical protein
MVGAATQQETRPTRIERRIVQFEDRDAEASRETLAIVEAYQAEQTQSCLILYVLLFLSRLQCAQSDRTALLCWPNLQPLATSAT